MTKLKITLFIVFFFIVSAPISAQNRIQIPLDLVRVPVGQFTVLEHDRPAHIRIGLALSGGGARGLAQIGVLKVFEREGLALDGISGSSMGAIIGGLYAAGYSSAQLDSITRIFDWSEIVEDLPPRHQLFIAQKENRSHILQIRMNRFAIDLPSAYTGGQKLTNLISDLVLTAPYGPVNDFSKLPIPFCAVSTDLISGSKVILNKGSLTDALRASMAVPLLFAPVPIDGTLLADGGILQNLPVEEAGNLGTDLVIAVDTTSKLRDSKALNAPWEIADQVTTIMQTQSVQDQLSSADIAIVPKLDGFSNTDFDLMDEIIKAGEEAAERALIQINARLTALAGGQESRKYTVTSISIEGCHILDCSDLLKKLPLGTGESIDESEIRWAGHSLLQTGHFETVSASIDTASGSIVFKVKENPVLKNIELRNNFQLSDSILFSRFRSRTDEVFNHFHMHEDLRSLVRLYKNNGYPLARLDSTRFRGGRLIIQIHEGTLSEIVFQGQARTRPFVLTREIMLKTGEPLTVGRLRAGIENIYSTGYFEGIRYQIRDNSGKTSLHIHLREHGLMLLRLGLRYDIERRAKAFLELEETNLLGMGYGLSLKGLAGNRDEMLELRLYTHRFLNTYINLDLRGALERRKIPYSENFEHTGDYNYDTRTISFSLGQQMRKLGALSLKLTSEEIALLPTSGENAPVESFTLRNIAIRSVFDSRDQLPFPGRGSYHVLSFETGIGFLGSEIDYTRFSSSMEFYYPLSGILCLHPRILWGTADLTTPIAKQFSFGGLYSFMGLPEYGALGKRILTTNLEMRFRIPWPEMLDLYLSFRYDFGGIWRDYSGISGQDFKHGGGLILSLVTPVGPLRFGWGVMNEKKSRFYFTAGFNF